MKQPQQDNKTILVILVLASIVAAWILLVSPARSEKSAISGQIAALDKQLNPPAPQVTADSTTQADSKVAVQSLAPAQLKTQIQNAAGSSKIISIRPVSNGFSVQVAGTLQDLADFFNNIEAAKMGANAQIASSSPLVIISQLKISNSPIHGTIATATLAGNQG